jgi:hypothetical protein
MFELVSEVSDEVVSVAAVSMAAIASADKVTLSVLELPDVGPDTVAALLEVDWVADAVVRLEFSTVSAAFASARNEVETYMSNSSRERDKAKAKKVNRR